MNLLNILNENSLNLAINKISKSDLGDNSFKKELDSNIKNREKTRSESNTEDKDNVILSHPSLAEGKTKKSVEHGAEVPLGNDAKSESDQFKAIETASEQVSVSGEVEVLNPMVPGVMPLTVAPIGKNEYTNGSTEVEQLTSLLPRKPDVSAKVEKPKSLLPNKPDVSVKVEQPTPLLPNKLDDRVEQPTSAKAEGPELNVVPKGILPSGKSKPDSMSAKVEVLASLRKGETDAGLSHNGKNKLADLSGRQVEVGEKVEASKTQRPALAPISVSQNENNKFMNVDAKTEEVKASISPKNLNLSAKVEVSPSLKIGFAPKVLSLNGDNGFTNVSGVDQNIASVSAVMSSINRVTPSNQNVTLVQKVMAYVKDGAEEKLSANNGFATVASASNIAEEAEVKSIAKDAQTKDPTIQNSMISKQAIEKIKSSAWGKQVANRALMMTQYGPRSIEINLDPPELGALQIRVNINASDQVSILFNAQNQAVKDAIAENFNSLKDLFEGEGLDLAEASVNDDKDKEASKFSWLDENGDVKDNFKSESKNKENIKTKLGIVDVYA
jgi:flagellar hook-length control protein FliK